MTPEEQLARQQAVQQAIMDKYAANSQDNSEIEAAKEEDRRNQIIGALASAANTAAHAQSASRGGPRADNSAIQALTQSQAVQEAIKNKMMRQQDLAQQSVFSRNAADDIRANQELDLKRQAARREAIPTLTPFEEENLALREREIALRERESGRKAAEPVEVKPTKLQESYDRKAGEELANWKASGGSEAVNASVKELESIQQDLLDPKNKGMTGSFIDKAQRVTGIGAGAKEVMKPEQTALKERIRRAALPGMKPLFPGTTSNVELETFMSTAWNDTLPPEANAAKLQTLIDSLKIKDASLSNMAKGLGEGSAPESKQESAFTPTVVRKTVNGVVKRATVTNQADLEDARKKGWE